MASIEVRPVARRVRNENARLGVETITRSDPIARSAINAYRGRQSISGTRPAVIEADWKKPSPVVQGRGAVQPGRRFSAEPV
jgi:hypothetical protein